MVNFIRFGVLCFLIAVSAFAQDARAQSQWFGWEEDDPPSPGNSSLGSGVAVSDRVAAIGAPNFEFYENPEDSQPAWNGLVNVYETDAGRTRWTLLTVLHLEDNAPENRAFGKAIAVDGPHLVVAADASLQIYERRHRDFRLVDTVVLNGATISESGPIQLARDVLAVSVLNNDTGRSNVRIFHIGPGGQARAIAQIPSRHSDGSAAAFSLRPDARALAISMVENNRRGIYIFESHGAAFHGRGSHGSRFHGNGSRGRGTHCTGWRRTAIVSAPSSGAEGFGASVAFSRFGLVVGAPYADQEYDYENNSVRWAGAVFAFRKAQHRWFPVQRLASNEQGQPSYASVQLGTEIVTNGPLVWITAPFAHDQSSSEVQTGSPLLYRWSAGRLEYVMDGPDSYPEGGIDMSRRYLIEGDVFYSDRVTIDGAHIVDLAGVTQADDRAGDDDADTSAVANPDEEGDTVLDDGAVPDADAPVE